MADAAVLSLRPLYQLQLRTCAAIAELALRRTADLIDANLRPVPHISPVVDGHLKLDAVVRGIRMIPAHIQIDSGCAAAHANDSQGPGFVRM